MEINEQQIKRIVQQEIAKNNNTSRFNLSSVANHRHDGIDSLSVNQNNIIPSSSIMGTIVIDDATTYTINLNSSFTPQLVTINGVLTGTSPVTNGTARAIVVGSAQLTPTFYLEDNERDDGTFRTVINTQNIQFPYNGKPAQNSSFLWTRKSDSANEAYAGASRDHLVSVFYGLDPSTSDDVARVTLTQFSRTSITLEVPVLVSGWTIFLNINIT